MNEKEKIEEIMEQISGEMVFWLLALGILVGLFIQFAMGKEGLGLVPNVISGGVGTVLMGVIAMVANLPAALTFGLLGCMSILFLMNVFSVPASHENEVEISSKK